MNCLQNKWIQYILNVLGTGALFLFIFVGAEYAFYRIAPMEFWLKYYDIRPIATSFVSTDKPKFESHFKVNRYVEVHYLDILRCNNERVSQDLSDSLFDNPGEYKNIWIYNSQTNPGVCYLESNITITLPYDINKTQKIIGDNFLIQ